VRAWVKSTQDRVRKGERRLPRLSPGISSEDPTGEGK
jgi:hypothetical protein